jgi:alcohol dehydrogenase class IV
MVRLPSERSVKYYFTMSTWVFSNAPLRLGRGSLEALRELPGDRFGLVVDRRALETSGSLAKAQALLEETGGTCEILADIQREPVLKDLDEPRLHIQEFQPQWIIAMGGGATLDVAKALWFFYEQPGAVWEDAFRFFAIPPLGIKARLVAVPTTSGTGSETTCVAVLVDNEGRKRLMMSRELIPSQAILDPDLADSMPPNVAATSGMDALAHALEAVVSRIASPMVVWSGLRAAEECLRWLTPSVTSDEEEGKKEARERMHYAANLAGMAINNASAGLSHALDQIGPRFGLPHGVVCAVLLPYTLAVSGPQPPYLELAERLGLKGRTPQEKCLSLVLRVRELVKGLGLETSFAALGVPAKDYEWEIPRFVQNAMLSGSSQMAPVALTEQQLAALFRQAYGGDPPTV